MGTIPVPYTPTAGDDATQARVLTWADAANYLLGNATSGGSKRPMASLRQTVAQSLTNAVENLLTFDVEDTDTDSGHSTVTNTDRYTAQTSGWYWVSGLVSIAANATGFRFAYLKINGTTFAATQASQPSNTAAVPTGLALPGRLLSLTAGDFLQVGVQQNSGGALLTSVAASTASQLSLIWVSN